MGAHSAAFHILSLQSLELLLFMSILLHLVTLPGCFFSLEKFHFVVPAVVAIFGYHFPDDGLIKNLCKFVFVT